MAEESVGSVYRSAWALLRLPAVRRLALVLFSCRAAFSPMDGMLSPKLVEMGLPKTHLAYVSTLLAPLHIVLPLLVRPQVGFGRAGEVSPCPGGWWIALRGGARTANRAPAAGRTDLKWTPPRLPPRSQLAKWTSGDAPWSAFLAAYPFRRGRGAQSPGTGLPSPARQARASAAE